MIRFFLILATAIIFLVLIIIKLHTSQVTVQETKTVQKSKAPLHPYVIPKESPFTYKGEYKEFPIMSYKGTAKINVKYKIHKDYKFANGERLIVIIFPNKKSVKILPYLTERPDEGTPSKIFIKNSEKIIPSLISKKIKSDLMKNNRMITGYAAVYINRFLAGYECDAPLFIADIKKVVKKNKKIKIAMGPDSGGC